MKLFNLGSYSPHGLPNVRFRPVLLDRLLEVAALLPLLANAIYVLSQYRRLGDAFPDDHYASLISAVAVFLLLFGAGYLPLRFVNFPFRVGPHNVVRQYLLALRLVRVLNIVLELMFLFTTLSVLHPWADAAVKGCVVLTCVVLAGYFWMAWRAR